jgi:hypothetical protein
MPVDFMLEKEAASSTPRATNLPAPGAAAAVHSAWQHTPGQTSRASRAAPGALSAARELLRHPPSSTASPRAMKQWRDDVDRLLGMAHSGSTRPRPRSSRCQYEASVSMRSPSVRAALTEDLRAELNRRRTGEDAPVSLERSNVLRTELNRRRAGEDAHVSLERARERRQNIEGCNLDFDFAAVAPQTPTGAWIQSGVPLAGVGCAALADHLRAATWPSKFRPHLPEKYDGTSNPSEFLQVYVTAITAAGGDTAVMATYFHVALSGTRASSPVSPMLPSLPLSARGCMMKRCWRSWPRMTWKLPPGSSLWPTSAPGPPRAVHGTRHHRPGLPRRVARVPSLRTAKRRRRTVAPRGRRLLLRSSQL